MSLISGLPEPVASYLALDFPEPPAGRPYVLLNMVASADGKAIVDGSESALSSATDKLTLQALRVHADAILNGSGTARATGVNPALRDAGLRARRSEMGRDRPPLQVLLTRTADFPPDAPFLHRTDIRLVIFATSAVQVDRLARLQDRDVPIEVVPDGERALPEVMRRLRQLYAVQLLLVEGGPTLNASLFRAGLIDEFFLTISPHVVAGADTITSVEGQPFTAQGMPQLDLLSALPNAATSEVYLHWRVRNALPDTDPDV